MEVERKYRAALVMYTWGETAKEQENNILHQCLQVAAHKYVVGVAPRGGAVHGDTIHGGGLQLHASVSLARGHGREITTRNLRSASCQYQSPPRPRQQYSLQDSSYDTVQAGPRSGVLVDRNAARQVDVGDGVGEERCGEVVHGGEIVCGNYRQ
ncbi:hypothetical protein K466DRAFT_182230 [Polyporus arcularius HHB13444]|uniref:Uncharacterized protein n=1 Tax=Polyporus arcularius HHB13444 TaxID=1314778 RepID=A0A5C3PTT0_9APHY|nr:hypothetical protein K466DRAFT_182230 [Polyporus arcularius HHB13444]